VHETSLNILTLEMAAVSALFTGLAFLFARQRGATPALLWWTGALAADTLRMVLVSAAGYLPPNSGEYIGQGGHAVVALLILGGALTFVGRHARARLTLAGAGLAALFIAGAPFLPISEAPAVAGLSILAALALGGTAWAVWRGYRRDGEPTYLIALFALSLAVAGLLSHGSEALGLHADVTHFSSGGWQSFTHYGVSLFTMMSLIFVTQQREHLERSRAKDRVQESKQRFADIAEVAGDWIWETGPDLRFNYFSDRIEEVLGLDPDTLLGKTRRELLGGDPDDPAWQQHLADLDARRPFLNFEYTLLGADRRPRYLRISGKPTFGPDGEFKGYRGTGTDLTAEIEAKQEAAKLDQSLRTAFESLPHAAALFDAADRLVYCNSKHAVIYPEIGDLMAPGMSFEDILRTSARLGMYSVPDSEREAYIQERLAYHRNPSETPIEQQLHDGRWVQISERKAADGATVVSWTDVTALKRRGEALAMLVESDTHGRPSVEAAAEALAVGLGCRWSGIGLIDQGRKLRILTVQGPGWPEEIPRFDYESTPGGKVLEAGGYCFFSDKLSELFPELSILAEMSATSYHGHPFVDANGNVVGHIFAMDDKQATPESWHKDFIGLIAQWIGIEFQRRRAEEALRDSEERIRTVMDNVADALVIVDDGGIIQSTNAATETLFGYSADQLMGVNVSVLMTGEDRENHDRHIQRYLSTGEARVLGLGAREVIGLAADGTEIDIEVTVSEMHHHGKRLFIGALRDISARKQADEALRQKTGFIELSKVVAAAANEATGVEDALEICLREICRYIRWPIGHAYLLTSDASGELAPSTIWHLDDPQAFENFRRITMAISFGEGVGLPGRVLAEKKAVWISDVTKDANFQRARVVDVIEVRAGFAFPVLVGSEVAAVLEFYTADVIEPDDAILEVTTHIGKQIGRVIERAQAERELLTAKETAELANRSKGEFLATMSHELRTPLNAIIGFSEIMAQELFGKMGHPNYGEYAEDIRASGVHLLEIINDILDVSKAEAGMIDLAEDELDLSELIEACLRLLQPRASEKSLYFETDLPPHPVQVRGDKLRLKQVLLNLLSNAVKFTQKGGVTVKLSVEQDDGVAIRVFDTGIGIDQKDIERVMEPFAQAASSLNRTHEGTGLGLPLSRTLVELHGGSLTIKSVFGKGTVATIRLPAERNVSASNAA
jgi:PAS domain S-box-containing protein